MKTLDSVVQTAAAASQSAWAEVYDIYLKTAITTPLGVTNVLRLTSRPGGVQFFTPTIAPEPSGTRGASQAYTFWPLSREIVKAAAKTTDDKLAITASNVTGEWAQMLQDVEWYDSPVVIRKVVADLASPAMDDCAVLFSGQVDFPTVDLKHVQLSCSSDFGTFDTVKPSENMHENCRFQFGDDMCGLLRFGAANYKSKTVGSGSTTTVVNSAGLTEDTGTRASYGTELIDPLPNASITASTATSPAYNVRSTLTSAAWVQDAMTDWDSAGSLVQGYWNIPSAQSGLQNAALKSWIQFDFGVARAVRVWRIQNALDELAKMPRIVLFFSSPDGSTWTFESFFRCPQPVFGTPYECLIPNASSRRYWRMCIRNKWANRNTTAGTPIEEMKAYEGGRQYWKDGWITFDVATTTVALRGISRPVLESYSGELTCAALPVAPVAGDTFVIERGCGRTFNDCCARNNLAQFGGFETTPLEEAKNV